MLLFERLQLAHQPVVLGVGDFRIVEHVVAIVVVLDLLAQLTHSGRGALRWARVVSCSRQDDRTEPRAAAGRRTLELAHFLAHALDPVHGERHAALVLQRAAEIRLQAARAGDQLVERMHARHRAREAA